LTVRRRKQLQITLFFTSIFKLRIAGAEGEAAVDESGGVGLAGGGELLDNEVEIWGGRAVADADDGEDLAVGLEVLPGARWFSA
jgi:hypothetical protein